MQQPNLYIWSPLHEDPLNFSFFRLGTPQILNFIPDDAAGGIWAHSAVLWWLPMPDALTPACAPCSPIARMVWGGATHRVMLGRSCSAHPISYTQPGVRARADERSRHFCFPVGKVPWQIWSRQFRMTQLCGSLWLLTTWRGKEGVMFSSLSAERGCGVWAGSPQVRAMTAPKAQKKEVCNKLCYLLVAKASPQREKRKYMVLHRCTGFAWGNWWET